jgi:hypothetical protein
MGVMSVAKPALPPRANPALRVLETIAVPRAWIREHGWPTSYADLESLVDERAPGCLRTDEARGTIAQRAYSALDVAYFRAGSEGQAVLYVQAWVGPA